MAIQNQILKMKDKLQNQAKNQDKNFKLIKKIAKHGSQSIIVIPRMLEEHLKPGTIVELNLNILHEGFSEDLKEEGR